MAGPLGVGAVIDSKTIHEPLRPDWLPDWHIREVEGGYEVFEKASEKVILFSPDYELARRIYIYPRIYRAAWGLNYVWADRVWNGRDVSDGHIEALSLVLGQMIAFADGHETLFYRTDTSDIDEIREPVTLEGRLRFTVYYELGAYPDRADELNLLDPWIRSMLINNLDPVSLVLETESEL